MNSWRPPLYNKEFNVIFRDKCAIGVIGKLQSVAGAKYPKFQDHCGCTQFYFSIKETMTSNWRDYASRETAEYNIKYYVNPKTHKDMFGDPIINAWVALKQIPKNADDYKRPKLLIGQAFTAGSPQVLDVPFYAGDNSVCSQSYIPIFSPSDTEEECLIIRKYMMTQFFRYLANIMKADQNISDRVFALIPMQKFIGDTDIDWSQSISDIDDQLFKKYKLTAEEVAYIKRTIKPMA